MKSPSVVTRSLRRVRRVSRTQLPPQTGARTAAVQVFLFRAESFLGSELFDIEGPVVVGRGGRSGLQLGGDTVSRMHCRILFDGQELLIEDLGSANGTYVNRVRVVGIVPVLPTDAIHIGAYTLKLRPLRAVTVRQEIEEETDATTRVEAVLSIESTDGSREESIDISAGFDRRLYDDAIRRATGGEAPREPMSSAAPPAVRQAPAKLPASDAAMRVDPDVEARLRDLDQLIALLDEKEKIARAEQSVKLRAIEGYLGKDEASISKPAPKAPPPPPVSEDTGASDISIQEEIEPMTTGEFARDLASRLALEGRVVETAPLSGAVSAPMPREETTAPVQPAPDGSRVHSIDKIVEEPRRVTRSGSMVPETSPTHHIAAERSRVASLPSAPSRAEGSRIVQQSEIMAPLSRGQSISQPPMSVRTEQVRARGIPRAERTAENVIPAELMALGADEAERAATDPAADPAVAEWAAAEFARAAELARAAEVALAELAPVAKASEDASAKVSERTGANQVAPIAAERTNAKQVAPIAAERTNGHRAAPAAKSPESTNAKVSERTGANQVAPIAAERTNADQIAPAAKSTERANAKTSDRTDGELVAPAAKFSESANAKASDRTDGDQVAPAAKFSESANAKASERTGANHVAPAAKTADRTGPNSIAPKAIDRTGPNLIRADLSKANAIPTRSDVSRVAQQTPVRAEGSRVVVQPSRPEPITPTYAEAFSAEGSRVAQQPLRAEGSRVAQQPLRAEGSRVAQQPLRADAARVAQQTPTHQDIAHSQKLAAQRAEISRIAQQREEADRAPANRAASLKSAQPPRGPASRDLEQASPAARAESRAMPQMHLDEAPVRGASIARAPATRIDPPAAPTTAREGLLQQAAQQSALRRRPLRPASRATSLNDAPWPVMLHEPAVQPRQEPTRRESFAPKAPINELYGTTSNVTETADATSPDPIDRPAIFASLLDTENDAPKARPNTQSSSPPPMPRSVRDSLSTKPPPLPRLGTIPRQPMAMPDESDNSTSRLQDRSMLLEEPELPRTPRPVAEPKPQLIAAPAKQHAQAQAHANTKPSRAQPPKLPSSSTQAAGGESGEPGRSPRQAARHEARLLTPTNLRIGVTPVPPVPAPTAAVVQDNFDDVWTSASRMQPNQAKKVRPRSAITSPEDSRGSMTAPSPAAAQFDAVEVTARARGAIIDVTKLSIEGEQYVLGHRTPHGKVAPPSAHPGLRMLRINPDRTVDLVFPREVGGHLVRGRETVVFSELTEGRKYSCLRLEARDIATMILGEGQRAVSYHIRFIRNGARD